MSELQKRLLMRGIPPTPPNMHPRGGASAAHGKRGPFKRDYTPVTWDKYFDAMKDLKVDDDNVYFFYAQTFRIYEIGSDGPICFFLHGGGFSALSWAVLSKILVAEVHCRCVAVDLRAHGDSVTTDEENLSAEQLSRHCFLYKTILDGKHFNILLFSCSDVANVVQVLYGDDPPPVILVGHSMGGAIAVHAACTAMEALSSMQSFLLSRPKTFKSVEFAVEWCVRSGQVRNLESAKVSMVGQVKRHGTVNEYTWRIDLARTEKYWRGWFSGLSGMFLSCNVPKMLLLAGVDRLDKDLTVGQMQGKFQMQVLPQCGHAVHEDVPDKVADVLATFMVRNKFAEPKENFQRTFPAC
ncbi:hypothetical protein LSH36_155g03001 [Paralvinella palmiformis]|uniref:Protein phosphatase methylesterase 1 n=1 Tax=Paralvinella palmiformis TaxID=53620 RepID=A0AAD9N8G1_9ANNE|nr:hypothetical protein LSH36_155g03001 [Paralvinella palmiformis]